jgi:acetyl-CoA carboxylase carboxyltransferase component
MQAFLRERDRIRTEMGSAEKVARLRAAGDRTARDWIDALLDPQSFTEIGTFVRAARKEDRPVTPGDSLIGGHGLVDGRPVSVIANDVTVKGGAGSRLAARRGERIFEQAIQFGNPFVTFGQAGGARVQEVIGSEKLSQGAGIAMAHRMRRIPMATAIVGRSYGDSSFSAACSDFVVQLRGSTLAVTSPRVIEIATGEKISEEELGGVDVHAERTGQIDLAAETHDEVVQATRRFLSYMPANGAVLPPRLEAPTPGRAPELRNLVPTERRRGYDMRKVITRLVDHGDFLEMKPRFARSLITALARFDGRSIGILASQPMQSGGAMTPEACDKAARFVAMCDSFHLPLVFLADTPGFLVGRQAEHAGLLNKAVMLNQALTQVRVPVLTFIVRKAYGLAYFCMAGGKMGAAYMMGWPTAEIGFMDPEVGANVIYGGELRELPPDARAAGLRARAEEMRQATDAYAAAVGMGLDEIVDPADTPVLMKQALDRLAATYDPARPRLLANWPTCF